MAWPPSQISVCCTTVMVSRTSMPHAQAGRHRGGSWVGAAAPTGLVVADRLALADLWSRCPESWAERALSRTAQSGMTRGGTRRASGVGAQAIAQEARDGRKAALLARGREEPLTGC
jgi:hypothetical protein